MKPLRPGMLMKPYAVCVFLLQISSYKELKILKRENTKVTMATCF